MIWDYDAQLRVSVDRILEEQKCFLVSESVESLTVGSRTNGSCQDWMPKQDEQISKIIVKANTFDWSNHAANTFVRLEEGETINKKRKQSVNRKVAAGSKNKEIIIQEKKKKLSARIMSGMNNNVYKHLTRA